MTRTTRTKTASRMKNSTFPWKGWSDAELLDLKICNLGVKIEGSPLESRIEQLHVELEDRGLRFRPHYWLSDEWFTPDGVPGVAIPFYLVHPRLERLERKQMFEVEGGSHSWCMRILRHEAGHAIDNAYLLHRRRSWQRVFGKSSQPYPDQYQPRPNSKSFVQHLGMWYAQAHPCGRFRGDFCRLAETAFQLAIPIPRLAGHEKTGICRSADDGNCHGKTSRGPPGARRFRADHSKDAATALRREERTLRDRQRQRAGSGPVAALFQ